MKDKLLADDTALTALRDRFPQIDMQHLRTLIRNARKEQAENKPPKAYREIYQILKTLHAEEKASKISANPDTTQDHEEE